MVKHGRKFLIFEVVLLHSESVLVKTIIQETKFDQKLENFCFLVP